MKVYLNGKIRHAAIVPSIAEPGFLFGWGVFETVRIYKGTPAFLSEHIERLKKGCGKIALRFPAVAFKKKIQLLLKENKLNDAHCRITLFKRSTATGVLITVAPLTQYAANDYKRGLKAIVVPFMRNSKDAFIDVKSISYVENMVARTIANTKGAHEALFCNESGFLTEGSRSNLFFVKGKTLYTPSLDCGLLNGITRQKVIAIVKDQGIRMRIGKFRLRDLLSSDEAFLTSSLMEVMPLVEVNKKPIQHRQIGTITQRIHMFYKTMIRPHTVH